MSWTLSLVWGFGAALGHRVETDLGVIEGAVNGDVEFFLGIPYAQSTAKSRRFMPPVPIEPFSSTFRANALGPVCYQPLPAEVASENITMDEDCLSLNIWRPQGTQSGADLEVMVWIYGGGFTKGAGSSAVSDGSLLAVEQGKIVVTLNYRLGAFGYFYSDELPPKTGGSNGGMNGALDQILALRFVRDHIRQFGGNPEAVTLFGESAGGFSTCYLLVSPAAKGLFRRAVVQSGPCVGTMLVLPNESSARVGSAKLLETFNATTLEDLRKVSATELAASGGFVMTADSVVLPLNTSVDELFESAPLNADEVIVGANQKDSVALAFNWQFLSYLVPPGTEPFDEEVYVHALRSYLPYLPARSMDEILSRYPLSDFGGNVASALVQVDADAGMICNSRKLADLLRRRGVTTYLYLFRHFHAGDMCARHADIVNTTTVEPRTWSTHASDVTLVFGTEQSYWWSGDLDSVRVPWTTETVSLSTHMRSYWGSFASTGTPSATGAPEWSPLPKDGRRVESMQLESPAPWVSESYRDAYCEFWTGTPTWKKV